MKRNAYILLFVLTCLAAGCGRSGVPGVEPGATIHRRNAGTPDASGWITATSTLGRFSVKVPIPFNDFTVENTNASSLLLKKETIGCRSTEGIKFSASKISYGTPGTAAKQFDKICASTEMPMAKITSTNFGGHKALVIFFGDAVARANQQMVLVGEELYVIAVEYPAKQYELAAEFIPTFFDSLEVRADTDR